jgi:hypothetical protein
LLPRCIGGSCETILLALAFPPLSRDGFFQKFHGLRHLLQIAGVQAEVLIQAVAQQPHCLSQVMGIAAKVGRLHAVGSLSLPQQGEQTHRHQPRVVEIRPLNVGQRRSQRLRSPLALVLDPLLHIGDAVLANGLHGGVPLVAELSGIETRGTA